MSMQTTTTTTTPTALQLTFVFPEEWTDWLLDESLFAAVRMKIENGVIFFKPSTVMNNDVLILRYIDDDWHAYIVAHDPMIERILRQLDYLGWSKNRPYFELHAAQRGWHGISLKPMRKKPDNDDVAYVRVQPVAEVPELPPPPPPPPPVLFQGPVTAEDVARILHIPL